MKQIALDIGAGMVLASFVIMMSVWMMILA